MNQNRFLTRVALNLGLARRAGPDVRMQTVNEVAPAPAAASLPRRPQASHQQVSVQSAQRVGNNMAARQSASSSGVASKPPASAPAPQIPDGLPTRASEADIHTVIPAAAQLNGDLQIEESIVLQCVVRGNVTQDGDHQVVLTASGGIHGTLRAQTAVIGGTVEGDVYAERIVMLDTGVINGNVAYVTLAMKEGATINGELTRVVPNVLGSDDGASAALLRGEGAGLRAVPPLEEERVA